MLAHKGLLMRPYINKPQENRVQLNWIALWTSQIWWWLIHWLYGQSPEKGCIRFGYMGNWFEPGVCLVSDYCFDWFWWNRTEIFIKAADVLLAVGQSCNSKKTPSDVFPSYNNAVVFLSVPSSVLTRDTKWYEFSDSDYIIDMVLNKTAVMQTSAWLLICLLSVCLLGWRLHLA